MAEDMPSLLSLEAELICSICMSFFEEPVTLPCGHNFCQGCLNESWEETFLLFCQQCRHHYSSKPELKKNTVLSAVVATFKKRSLPSGSDHVSIKAKKSEFIKCDMCMVAKAFKTCLTCMASFCEEHVKPHLENPIFRPHQLTDPLTDLQGQICQDHNKVLEFFCKKHDCSICAICLQQSHQGCEHSDLQEAQAHKKSEMTSMLHLLDRKIDKNRLVMAQVREQQLQLEDDAEGRKKMLTIEYQFLRDLIDKEEQDALRAIEKNLEGGQTKIQSFIKKFGENVEKMSAVKMELQSLLSRADSLSFLQASSPLATHIIYDPYCSHVNMDSKTLTAYHSFAVAVKELLTKILTLPVENRFPLLKPGQTMEAADQTPMSSAQHTTQHRARSQHRKGAMREAAGRSVTPVKQATRARTRSRHRKGMKDETSGEGGTLNQQKQGLSLSRTNLTLEDCSPKKGAQMTSIPPDIPTTEKRSELLKFGTVLKLNPRTAHKRIVLTEDLTKASLAERPCQYPDGPERFAVCSQVLCSQSFRQGRHYWEVKITKNNSCGLGLGLAYGSMDRSGPSSRLGLNSASWCMEWFNDKLSAWHDGIEAVLGGPGPGRVGLLLDCDKGFATFYAVADRAYPLHTFVFHLREPVYPAFWIFSANSSISLCKLT